MIEAVRRRAMFNFWRTVERVVWAERFKIVRRMISHTKWFRYKFIILVGHWLWLSWHSSHLRHQRCVVWIRSSSKFILNIVYCYVTVLKKWKEKKKWPRNGPFEKVNNFKAWLMFILVAHELPIKHVLICKANPCWSG